MPNFAYIMRKPDGTLDHIMPGFASEEEAEDAAAEYAKKHEDPDTQKQIDELGDSFDDIPAYSWEVIEAAPK